MKASSLRVLIVGAGIAGLSTAIALGRRGVHAQLVERSKHWDVYGVGIILQSNAIRALDALGLADACVAAGYPYSVSTHGDQAGNPFRDRPKPNVGDARFPSSCGVQRRTLHRILSERAMDLGARVQLDCTIRGLQQSGQEVEVALSDGRCERFDLVIAADGTASATRRLVFGDMARPSFTGQGCWRFTTERSPAVDRAFFQHGPHGLAGLIPVSQTQMYLLLLTAEPGNPWFAMQDLQRELSQRLAGFGGMVGQVGQRVPPGEDIVYRPLEPMLMPAPWHSGRVVLIGDAAHSTTPHLAQGASMAFEDAVVLDDLLFNAGLDVPNALSAFTARRFQRCERIVTASMQMGAWQLAQWRGQVAADADPIQLSAQVLEELREPI